MAGSSPSLLASYRRLVRVRLLGRTVELPENNTLLRGLAWLDPEGVTCGRFCWNGECNNSKFYFRLAGETVERKARACRYPARDGMEIKVISTELRRALREVLRSTTPDPEGKEPEDGLPRTAGGRRP